MKKLLAAVAAIATMGVAVPASAEYINTGVCDVTISKFGISGIGTVKTVDDDDIDCIKGTRDNRDWVVERLGTQIHYFNKAVEPMVGSDYVGDNGAYWGHVTSVRNSIQSYMDHAALGQTYLMKAKRMTSGFQNVCDTFSDLVEEGHLTENLVPWHCGDSYFTDHYVE